MKASELRIGNLLEFSNGIQPNKIITVGRRFFSSAAIEKEDGDFHITPYYNPIPLTEEWLVRFGFEIIRPFDEMGDNTNAKHKIFPFGLIKVMWQESKWRLDPGCFDQSLHLYWLVKNTITSVHQLQNLVFAISGEELTTTPIQ